MEFRRFLEDKIREKNKDLSINVHKVEFLRKDYKIRIYLSTTDGDENLIKKLVEEEVDSFLNYDDSPIGKDITIIKRENNVLDIDCLKSLCNKVFSMEPVALSFFREASIKLDDYVVTIAHYNEILCKHMERKSISLLMKEYMEFLWDKEYVINIVHDSSLFKNITPVMNPYNDIKESNDVNRESINSNSIHNEPNINANISTNRSESSHTQNNVNKEKSIELNKVNSKENSKENNKENSKDENIILGKEIKDKVLDIEDLELGMRNVAIAGEIFKVEERALKIEKNLFSIYVFDGKNSIICKAFVNKDEDMKSLQPGIFAKLKGTMNTDSYTGEDVLMVNHIMKFENKKKRMDKSPKKRVELHAHTTMSAMDSLISAKTLVKTAISWGHKAIAITDHGVVQAYPEAMDTSRTKKEEFIKVIYGMEAYVVDDLTPIVSGNKNISFNGEYVVFDIETTGFSNTGDAIIEIGAVKVNEGKVIDRYSAFIDPLRPLPGEIIELTKITDSMVKGQPTIDKVLPEFLNFCGDTLLVAHNANFDMGFIRRNAEKLNLPFKNEQMDTVPLARFLFPDLKRHRLDTIAKTMGIPMGSHHRAVDDAETTARILLRAFEMLQKEGIDDTDNLNKKYLETFDITKGMPSHCTVLAKNQLGLKTIYELVSKSHLEYFFRNPRIPKSLLLKNRENLILGSACSSSELYKAILDNRPKEVIESIAQTYDFLEVMPIRNNKYLMDEKRCTKEELEDHVRYIISLGDKFNKPVVATGDVHMLNPEEEPFRRIIKHSQGFGGGGTSVPLPFLTTEEMLDAFSFLSDYQKERIVIEDSNYVADMIEPCLPIPYETYPPKMEGAEEEIRNMTMENAWNKYGKPLPEIVEKRVKRELDSIIGNGYAVLYLVAHKLVKKSLDDGYLVGSRGSVGSSLVATFTDITEVNGLPPHYVCPNCKNSEFFLDTKGSSGVDLPPKKCPVCGTEYDREGHEIPFETFLGFEGDKEPDIDLNFSGEYQPVVHKYCEELFGTGFVFRAGTIGTVAEKTAKGYVRKYFEDNNEKLTLSEMERLSQGCTGIKRTTGQHPGGIMVVPSDNDIHNFCPVQHPADDVNTDIITTHFDYHSISGRLLKLDILGHDDPTVLRMLQDITNIDPKSLPLNDPEVLAIFTGTETLGVTPEELGSPVGTFGIPEFGTKFVRQMLVDTKPTCFSDLVRISGLSHGTDVWLNNAQDFIKNGDTDLAGCISLRDNIMIYLISCGLPSKEAFFITEKVRKGKGLKPEDEALMRENKVPEWYIESCKRIKYMFPKGHAVAYVTMAMRIAWFKVHMPLHYYATYFSVRAKDFDAQLVLKGEGAVKARMDEINALGKEAPQKDQVMINVLEIIYEMFKRGFTFQNVDLFKSHYDKFLVDGNTLIPPFSSVSGVPESQAQSIYEAAKKGEFISKEDFRIRTGVTKTVMEALDQIGCFRGLGETNQISFF